MRPDLPNVVSHLVDLGNPLLGPFSEHAHDYVAKVLGRKGVRMHLGDGTAFKWELGDGEALVRLDVRGPLALNETEATVQAAVDGVGLGYMLEGIADGPPGAPPAAA